MPRLCEMTLPEVLVARLEQLPGGMAVVLSRVEREFGLSTTSAHVGNRKYAIVGPNPDILELAIETLQRRFTILDCRNNIPINVYHIYVRAASISTVA